MLRQYSQIYGRTLLGMLLFVWLSMAITPCVMANDLDNITAADIANLHSNMDNCSYCPESHDGRSEQLMTSQVICNNTHNNFSDTISLNIDSLDSVPCVLFELPGSVTIIQSKISLPFKIPKQTNVYHLSPLSLTGILRI
ncbi:MAG: hypothetical protein KZQ83_04270 [gamma proteobacterium symbiont of Taylorina sp.]|nr:hypothetical protein [gamma proteobacterium symbiont of Taylorina sp.]